VLAHGLDQIYPSVHRKTAAEMIEKGGGLLTEFPSGTHVERAYFLQRNRIVAGMADATIIIQGAYRSGSMVTADITDSYGRELFACPGRVGDEMSEGCNRLIQTQKAHMMLSVDDLLREMSWPNELLRMQTMQDGVQQTLFPDMTPEERKIVDALRDADGCTVNEIAQKTGLPIGSLSGLLFSMEMKGVLRQGAGGRYTL
jgi:DNA processing protein